MSRLYTLRLLKQCLCKCIIKTERDPTKQNSSTYYDLEFYLVHINEGALFYRFVSAHLTMGQLDITLCAL